jgi:hypothetical protein
MSSAIPENEITEVSEKVKEYAEISKIIKMTQEKLKVLNKKKKELYKEVLPKLETTNITKCNLAFGTIKVVQSKRKIMPTKVTIKEKYISFFNNRFLDEDFILASPEQKAQILYDYIYVDNIEFKKQTSMTLTYSKEFKNSLKNL